MIGDGPVIDDASPTTGPLAWRQDPAADLTEIEGALGAAAIAKDVSLTEIAGHLIAAGGKRLRPALVAAAGLIDGAHAARLDPRLVQAAVSVELVHLGSLYHDDVIDGADLRRGVETVNHRWGDLKAILAGDFLLARASELAAVLSTEIAELLAETIGWLCEGQIRELRSVDDIDRTESAYFEAIDAKTASLFSTACRIGGLVADLGPDTIDHLTEYGRAYGTAFQICDDVSDLTASPAQLGKPVGGDIRGGVFTLPVIRQLRTDDGHLAELLARRSDPEAAAAACRLVRDGAAIASSLDTAGEHAAAALASIDGLSDSPAVQGLRNAARALVPR